MEYALSQKDGTEYRAMAVSYDKAIALGMICPVCGGKVFKRVRWTPEENHCFVHHKGGSLDCELYHAGASTLTSAAFDAMARGQDFQLFVKQAEQGIEGLLTKTRVVVNIHRVRLDSVREAIASIDFEMDDESIDLVEECASAHLGEAGIFDNVRVSRILDAKLRFYHHPQARFIDKIITSWMLYGLATKHPLANIDKLADVMTTNTIDLEKTAGLIFAGLAARDAGVGVSWFSWDFDRLLDTQERGVPKSILKPKSDRPKLERHGQSHEDATIINKKRGNTRPEAYAQRNTPPNLVDERFESRKQMLIEAGYRFQPFGLGIIDVAIAPDGKPTKIYSRLDLDRLLKTANIERRAGVLLGKGGDGASNRLQTVTSQSKQVLASSRPKLFSLPSDPEIEKLLRDLQDFGWKVNHDGMKWTIVKGGWKHYSWTAEDLKKFWHSKIQSPPPSDPKK